MNIRISTVLNNNIISQRKTRSFAYDADSKSRKLALYWGAENNEKYAYSLSE
jgi:hypothetical protein